MTLLFRVLFKKDFGSLNTWHVRKSQKQLELVQIQSSGITCRAFELDTTHKALIQDEGEIGVPNSYWVFAFHVDYRSHRETLKGS